MSICLGQSNYNTLVSRSISFVILPYWFTLRDYFGPRLHLLVSFTPEKSPSGDVSLRSAYRACFRCHYWFWVNILPWLGGFAHSGSRGLRLWLNLLPRPAVPFKERSDHFDLSSGFLGDLSSLKWLSASLWSLSRPTPPHLLLLSALTPSSRFLVGPTLRVCFCV